jgi:hypothetical protein
LLEGKELIGISMCVRSKLLKIAKEISEDGAHSEGYAAGWISDGIGVCFQ